MSQSPTTSFNEYGHLGLVGIRHARNAFSSDERLDAEWKKLRFHNRPDLDEAVREYDAFRQIFTDNGTQVIDLPADDRLTLDSIYPRDNILVSPGGLILCNMGRASRTPEADVNVEAYKAAGFEIAGRIEAPGTLEGGDFIWLDEKTAVVGLGPRTNEEGIRQLKTILGDEVELYVTKLPEPPHPDDVLHLMSIISPVDRDLAVIYRPEMEDEFADWLTSKGIGFVLVPDEEYPIMACNVLALAPRKVLMLENLPATHKRLLDAGCEVITYKGMEISRQGEGGPTCLTRPLVRD